MSCKFFCYICSKNLVGLLKFDSGRVSLKIRSQDSVEEETVVSDLPERREEFSGCVIAPHCQHVVLD